MTDSIDDDRAEEHMQRFHKPDGYCLHCQRPANQHHPVGPITITISAPDSDEIYTHEFCNWECLAGGQLCRPGACSSSVGTDHRLVQKRCVGPASGCAGGVARTAEENDGNG